MSTENMSFNSMHPTPNQALNTSTQQNFGNWTSTLRRPLPALVEEAVERAFDKKLKELSATIKTQFDKPLKTLTAEVNRLKNTSDRLNPGHKQASTRSLDAVLRKIVLKLDTSDTPKMLDLGPSGILKRLGSLGDPYKHITSARIYPHITELVLFTESLPVHEQLKKKDKVATIAKALDLAPSSSIKLQKYWVILHEYNLSNEYLTNCKEHLKSIRGDTGLDISEVKFIQQRFLWGFRDPREAIKACQEPLFFSGDHALAMWVRPETCGANWHTD